MDNCTSDCVRGTWELGRGILVDRVVPIEVPIMWWSLPPSVSSEWETGFDSNEDREDLAMEHLRCFSQDVFSLLVGWRRKVRSNFIVLDKAQRRERRDRQQTQLIEAFKEGEKYHHKAATTPFPSSDLRFWPSPHNKSDSIYRAVISAILLSLSERGVGRKNSTALTRREQRLSRKYHL